MNDKQTKTTTSKQNNRKNGENTRIEGKQTEYSTTVRGRCEDTNDYLEYFLGWRFAAISKLYSHY